ncbi:N-acyl homoserine lactonase family protein [Cryptosporangium sp. NPDC051539]|uniref:N-acyl homoserine lactonase family protein n=1 Tax=Cryptosporangium sp. NPDC051539 TaxID=3363962 RepID=UPI0037B78765
MTLEPDAAPPRPSTVDRIYVLDGGQAHVRDISPWSPGVGVRESRVFSDNAYLIVHGGDLLVWDSGVDDALIDSPGGEVVAHDVRGVKRRSLVSQFAELGVDPARVTDVAFSHAHFDHVGNSRLFSGAVWYVQRPEYEAMFGPDPGAYGFLPRLYETMLHNQTVLLDGDRDIFGDGSVTVLSTPGHTPGHQSLLVRLPRTGPVILSGDVAHFAENFEQRRVPTFNADHAASLRSMERIDALCRDEGAQLWINHDLAQSDALPHAPAPIE